jgi:predicted permease
MDRIMGNVLQDIRYAFRMFRRNPVFTGIAILSLALGIGANSAIYSLVDKVMFRALPVRNPEELALFNRAYPYPRYEQFRDQNDVFAGIFAACAVDQVSIETSDTGPANDERITGRLVSGSYFQVLGTDAVLGRTLTPDDDKIPDGHPVVVLSHGFWKRRFGSDPSVIGRTIRLGPGRLLWGVSQRPEDPTAGFKALPELTSFTVVGVTRPDFFGETVGDAPDFWTPMMMQGRLMPGREWLKRRDIGFVRIVARLEPGLPLAQAQARTTVLFQQLLTQDVGSQITEPVRRQIQNAKVTLLPGGRGFVREEHGKNFYTSLSEFFEALWILMAVVGVVLLIACANLASLLLARATARRKEIAVRLSLGAGRRRLMRQLLTESVLLALIGGTVGLVFAGWGTSLLVAMASAFLSSPIAVEFQPDVRVVMFTGAISLLTGVIFGLAPAFSGTQLNLSSTLKDSAANVSGSVHSLGLRKLFVVAQVAMSLVLLVAAALFVRSLRNQQSVDIGYARGNLLLLRVDPLTSGYRGPEIAKLAERVRERLSAIPGVQGVTYSENGLFSGPESAGPITAEGHIVHSEADMIARFDQIGPGYFSTIGIPILLGRDISPQDVADTPRVAVINEAMASFYFPDSSPVGKRIFWMPGKRTSLEIIGVARNVQDHSVRWKPTRRFYVPLSQAIESASTVIFEVRTSIDPKSVIADVRREVRAEDATLPVLSLRTLDELMARSMLQEGLIAQLSGFFGVVALVLATIGLYGVMSYMVARRTNEIGIRMALGARPQDVQRMVFWETLRLVLLGVAIGIPASLACTRLVSSRLFGLKANDPLTIAGVTFFMILVAAVAGFVPARRASRVDPLTALRYE